MTTFKCTESHRGSAPDPAVEAYSAPPGPLAGFRGPDPPGKGLVKGWKGGRERGWGRGKARLAPWIQGGIDTPWY